MGEPLQRREMEVGFGELNHRRFAAESLWLQHSPARDDFCAPDRSVAIMLGERSGHEQFAAPRRVPHNHATGNCSRKKP
jgi:hypothetical protein